MECFRKKQMREQLTKMIGSTDTGKEMIELILKANFEGFSQEEQEAYNKQKEEEIKYFRERLDNSLSQPVESKTIYGEIISTDSVDDNGIKKT